MTRIHTVPLLLTFVSGFVVAQERQPQPTETTIPQNLQQIRCKASKLIGCAITNQKNESLGEIKDIVLDSRNQRVAYVVVGFGGKFGLGKKYFALPWHLIEIEQRSSDALPRATLGCDLETLKAAPGFDNANWPDMAHPDWASRVDQYYRDSEDAAAPAGSAEPKGSTKDGFSDPAQPIASAAPSHCRFSQILGTHVINAQRAFIADVEDLVIDVESARIEGVLLSFGGVLGVGENVALVPAEALTHDASTRAYVLPCSAERLSAMALKDATWPALGNDTWLTSCREACLVARKESEAKGTAMVVDAAAHTVPKAKYELGKVAEMRGTIVTVGTVANVEPDQDLVRLRIRLEAGREVVVHAGPASFAQQRALDLRPGCDVRIVGAPCVFDERTVVLAGKLEVDGKSVSLRDKDGMPTWLASK